MRVADLTTSMIVHAIEIAFRDSVTGKVLVSTQGDSVIVTQYTDRTTSVKRRWRITVRQA
jgi:hypothetical protein